MAGSSLAVVATMTTSEEQACASQVVIAYKRGHYLRSLFIIERGCSLARKVLYFQSHRANRF